MKFRSKIHQQIFSEICIPGKKYTPQYLSALYLLTADHRIWECSKAHVHKERINFNAIRLPECKPHRYAIFCAARELYCHEGKFSIGALADPELITTQTFDLICSAVMLHRKADRKGEHN